MSLTHNFCEIHQNDVSNALKNDAEFQPQIRANYTINNNEGNGKASRNIFVKILTKRKPERNIIYS